MEEQQHPAGLAPIFSRGSTGRAVLGYLMFGLTWMLSVDYWLAWM